MTTEKTGTHVHGGVRLFYRASRPESVRAVAVVVHGMTEHSGRYVRLRNALNEAGILFAAQDHRGHGLSEGRRGDVSSFENYVDDLAAFCEEVRGWEPQVGFFVIGHSMGSLIAAQYAARRPRHLDGLVLSSLPVIFGSGIRSVPRPIITLLGALVPRVHISPRLDPSLLSGDPAVIQEYLDDSLVLKQITWRFANELTAAARRLPGDARAIRAPVLFLHGTEDAIADVRGTDLAFRAIGSEDKTRRVFDGLRHELFNETAPERRAVLRVLTDWLIHHADGPAGRLTRNDHEER